MIINPIYNYKDKNISPDLKYASYKEFGDLARYMNPSLNVRDLFPICFFLDLFKDVKYISDAVVGSTFLNFIPTVPSDSM